MDIIARFPAEDDAAKKLFEVWKQLGASINIGSEKRWIGGAETLSVVAALTPLVSFLIGKYFDFDHPDRAFDAESNTENQIRSDVRRFYFFFKAFEVLNSEPSFWSVCNVELTRMYEEGIRDRYRRFVLPAAADLIATAHDKAWLAECDRLARTLDRKQKKEIRYALAASFGLQCWS